MARYNKTARAEIRKSFTHIEYAIHNLGYGILQSDFKTEREQLEEIKKRLTKIWWDEKKEE